MHTDKFFGDANARFAAIVLVFVTICAYLPVIVTGGFIWDDDSYVTRNVLLWEPNGLYRIWFDLGSTPQYYPLTYTTFWLEYHLWDLWPTGYHIVNVLLHAGNSILLWVILETLSVPGAWFIAAVFALHPVHVESTAWITERKNVLSGFFYFTALLCYMRFSPFLFSSVGEQVRQWSYYWFAYLLFFCALLSKTVTCSLPAVILLLVWWQKKQIRANDALLTAPMFAVGLSMALLTAWLEKSVVGAVGDMWSFSLVEKILLAGHSLWFYAYKLIWPSPLSFFYPQWNIDTTVWWQYLFPMSAIALILFLTSHTKSWGSAPLVAVLFFIGTLVPALGFFSVYSMRYSYVADHFQYLASVGVFALIGGGLWYTQGKASFLQEEKLRTPLQVINEVIHKNPYRFSFSLMILLLFGSLTWKQGYVYENARTVWLDTIEKTPLGWMPYNNLGVIAVQDGNFLQAVEYFEKAVALNPDSAQSHMNLCSVYKRLEKFDNAIEHGERAIKLWPDWPKPYSCVGTALLAKGEPQQAARYFHKGVEYAP